MNPPMASDLSGTALCAKPGEDLIRDIEIDLGPLAGQISATPAQVCKALPCGPTKLYELLGSGELRSYKIGKARRIMVSSVRDYLVRQIMASRTVVGFIMMSWTTVSWFTAIWLKV